MAINYVSIFRATMSQEGPEGVKRELGFAHQFSVLGNWDFHSVFYHREWDGLNATGNGKKII